MTATTKKPLNIGIIGAGLGGLMAGIAIAEAGGNVTILEAASKLGEVRAGIQLTPNAARLLYRYGIEELIGENLVRNQQLHIRTKEGKKVGFVKMEEMKETSGGEWWLVHRQHLHRSLVAAAANSGCSLVTSARVTSLDYKDPTKPVVVTTKSAKYTFDLVLGADGVNGMTRKTLFPNAAIPFPPRNNAAFRAIVPASRLREDPDTKGMVYNMGINVWLAPNAYAILYPISGGEAINVVLSHTTTVPLVKVEAVELEEVERQYSDFEIRVRKVVSMIDRPIKRWPLLVTHLDRWSSDCRRVVLMGDAAHSMVNHMAQGASTAIEDAVFLSVLLKPIIDNKEEATGLYRAIELYEKERMPVVKMRQEASNRNGWIMHLSGVLAAARNFVLGIEWKYPNLLGAQNLMRGVYRYDAVAHAEKWVTSEEARCPTRSFLEHYEQQPHDSKKHIDNHLSRPHLLISSIPNPAEPVEITLPSTIKTKTNLLDIQNIANLWTQLLCIQTQNGNFIRHGKWDQEKEGLQMCISQMNPEECTKLRRDLTEADPPVEEAVADLICSLPYASCNDETYKIAPCTMMTDPKIDRELYSFGPILPPHLMRLTDCWGEDSGMLILIDVLTGITTELTDYKPGFDDGDPHGEVMTEWNGPKKPIEDLLHEWIENYLSMRWIPDGSMDVMDSEGRSMIFLKYLALFNEFDWPSAFPLSKSQSEDFLRRHAAFTEGNNYSDEKRYIDIWHKLNNAWYNSDMESSRPGENPRPGHRRLQMLDQKIRETLRYEEQRANDMAYATATGGDITERLRAPTRLHDSATIGDDWIIDVTAADIMERFWDIIDFKPELGNEEVDDSPLDMSSTKMKDLLEKMGKVMEAAYHRYLDPEEAEREARMVGVPDEDDDSTSDFEVDSTDEDDSSDNMDDPEEEVGSDLDVTALQTDMDLDVEGIRQEVVDSQVTTPDTQASSQTL
ncbi:Salicylate hydroxylase [Venturia nashicola]|uniref:Salicylate hydroxylase n=1 Tax=Venturia nashicola TaxID=86259 RepID=A0A4Z1P7B3_9PEZI|nr:Salicylate hydroxylase [Venturia nashicola]